MRIKPLFYGVGVLIVLLLAASFFIPASMYREPIANAVQESLGRKLEIAGDLKFSLLPLLKVTAEDIRLSNPAGYKDAEMVEAKEAGLSLKLFPLLGGKMEIDQVTLEHPVISLEQKANGESNWQFGHAKPKPQSSGPSERRASLSLQELNVRNGVVRYRADGKLTTLEKFNLTASLPASGRATVSFDFRHKNEPYHLKLKTEDAGAILTGGKVDAEVLTAYAAAEGVIHASGKDSWKIALKTNRPVKGEGDMTVHLGSVTSISGGMRFGALDFKPFFKDAPAANAKATSEGQRWSREPIRISIPANISMNLALQAEALSLPKFSAGETKLGISVQGGALALSINTLKAYEGTLTGSVHLSREQVLSTDLKLLGMQLEPLFKETTGKVLMKGTVEEAALDLSGKLISQAAFVESMGGQAHFKLKDGSVKGINVLRFVRDLEAALVKGEDAAQQGEETQFASLAANFSGAQGVWSTKDLAAIAPQLQVKGEGAINLPLYRVDMRLTPTLQAGKPITIPLLLAGTLDHPVLKPDTRGLLQKGLEKGLKDPKKTLEDAKGLLKGLLKD